jgi:hypothetical protein
VISRIERVERWRQRPGARPGEDWSQSYTADYTLAEGASLADAKAALHLVERLDARAGQRDCGQAVGFLKLLTVSKALTPDDLKAQINALSALLAEYPLDAVKAACREWADTQRFFPTWTELREKCLEGVLLRRALASALRGYIELREAREREVTALAKPETPANALWRSSERQIVAILGESVWNTWLKELTPVSDNGTVYELAAPSKFTAMHVKESFGEALEEILSRRVAVNMYHWAGDAARDRERKERRGAHARG